MKKLTNKITVVHEISNFELIYFNSIAPLLRSILIIEQHLMRFYRKIKYKLQSKHEGLWNKEQLNNNSLEINYNHIK